MKLTITAILCLAFLAGCGNDNNHDHGCNVKNGAACPLLFGPVCVQTPHNAFCYEANDCIADAKCETKICQLGLDDEGNIDPNSACTLAHPDCLSPCPQ